MQKISHVFGLWSQETPKTAILATIDMHRVSQGFRFDQGRSQGGATGSNATARLSGAPEDLLLAYVESP